jgi:hypothetical protein
MYFVCISFVFYVFNKNFNHIQTKGDSRKNPSAAAMNSPQGKGKAATKGQWGNAKASIAKGKNAVDANTDERGAVYAEPELVQISLEHTALNKCEYIKKINNNFIYIIQIVFINKGLESANLRDFQALRPCS